MEKSRTEYSTMNTVVAMISRIAAILMGFVTRVSESMDFSRIS